jgi:hypothetical protein
MESPLISPLAAKATTQLLNLQPKIASQLIVSGIQLNILQTYLRLDELLIYIYIYVTLGRVAILVLF